MEKDVPFDGGKRAARRMALFPHPRISAPATLDSMRGERARLGTRSRDTEATQVER